jgi:glutaredoxin
MFSQAAEDVQAVASRIPGPEDVKIDLRKSVVFFHSDTCPHCHAQERWFASIKDDFPDLTFYRYEIDVAATPETRRYFQQLMDAYNSNTRGWPRMVAGTKVFIGFVPENGTEEWHNRFEAFVGYQNMLGKALVDLQQSVRKQATAENNTKAVKTDKKSTDKQANSGSE